MSSSTGVGIWSGSAPSCQCKYNTMSCKVLDLISHGLLLGMYSMTIIIVVVIVITECMDLTLFVCDPIL